jgi:hypothetical protein
MSLHPRPNSKADQLAHFFREHPNEWIDGKVLASLAGGYAWRTRVSDVRRPPFSLTIENRQRRVVAPNGSTFVVSEYRHPRAVARDAVEIG